MLTIQVLKILYPDAVKHNNYSKTLTSVAFAGTVVGMLIFGWISDKIGRKFGMVCSTSETPWRPCMRQAHILSDGCYRNRCLVFRALSCVGWCPP